MPVQQKIGDFLERALFGEILDRVATVSQTHAFFPDCRNRRLAGHNPSQPAALFVCAHYFVSALLTLNKRAPATSRLQSRQSRNYKTICGVLYLGPGRLWNGLAGKQWPANRRELYADTNGTSTLSQIARKQKFIIPKTAIRCLDTVFRRSQLGLRIRIDAGVSSRQIPYARFAPFRRPGSCVRHKHFGPLIRELVIEF